MPYNAVRAMTVSSPLVSVIIPAHNCGRYITDALDSVFSQGYTSIEVLVIDDGSTDDTCDVVRRYRFPVTLIQQANQGAAVARNEGLRRAAGKYIAFLDADDLWTPGKLSTQVTYLEQHPDTAMCCARWRVIYPDASGEYVIPAVQLPSTPGTDPEWSGWIYCNLLLDCEVHTITVMMRRELVERVGFFDAALRRGQDYDYWLRTSRVTRIDRLNVELAIYRRESGVNPAKFPNTNWELRIVERAIEKWGTTAPDGNILSPSLLRKRLWELKFRFGYNQFHTGRHKEARVAFASALRNRPAHLKTWLYLAVCLFRKR